MPPKFLTATASLGIEGSYVPGTASHAKGIVSVAYSALLPASATNLREEEARIAREVIARLQHYDELLSERDTLAAELLHLKRRASSSTAGFRAADLIREEGG